jgi:hypothetical protein
MSFEEIAQRISRHMELMSTSNGESATHLLRDALLQVRDTAISTTRTLCLEIAEEEAERARANGAVAGHQTALIIAARIRKREVDLG